jgi:hypothetical protein
MMLPMFEWLRKAKSKPPEVLRGAPAVRRQKTRSAASGYVYQYFYEGFRQVREGVEYVFDVSSDRKNSFPVTVLVESGAIASWNRNHGRELAAAEKYALAKIALFQAFDERDNPGLMRQEVRVRAADAAAILETLGIS